MIDLPFLNIDFNFLDKWLEPVLGGVREVTANTFIEGTILSLIALAIVLGGIALGYLAYRRGLNADGTDPVEVRLGGFAGVLEHAYYIDDLVAWFVSVPGTIFAKFLARGVDKNTIDGAVNGIGKVTREGGVGLRRLQTGLVRNYALGDRVRHRRVSAVRRDKGEPVMVALLDVPHGTKLSYPILTLLVLAPFVGAVIAMLTPRRRPEIGRAVGYVTSAGVLGVALFLLTQFDTGPIKGNYQLYESHSLLGSLGVRWSLGVDGISLFMVVLTALLIPIGLLASAKIEKPQSFTVWMLLLEGSVIGVFLSLDALMFFVFFEFSLVPMYFLIVGLGSRQPSLRGDEVLLVHDGRARRSCSSASSPSRSCISTTRASSPSISRRSPTTRRRTSAARRPRRCSSRSRSASRSRFRSSRSIPGCPMRTPTRRPRVRSYWPA